MNRTALCIKMLSILNTRGLVSRAELAQLLETNVRNISEFKKELEVAGYPINYVSGRYGGYRLAAHLLLPMVKLTKEEKSALSEGVQYLTSHSDFLPVGDYQSAMDKVMGSVHETVQPSILFKNGSTDPSEKMREMISICELCRQSCQTVQLVYKSMRSDAYKKIRLQPYELLNVKGYYYVLGYNADIHEFRVYKFSEARMQSCTPLPQQFTRDLDFDVKTYIGQTGLVKDEVCAIDCLISGDAALLIYESEVGINSQKEWIKERELHLQTMMEGRGAAIRFILSLGDACTLLAPQSLKQELRSTLLTMLDKYDTK